MDGCDALWDTGVERLLCTSEFDSPSTFHFHRGCDAVAGSGFGTTSNGPDQGVGSFVQYLPSGIRPLTYNRMATASPTLAITGTSATAVQPAAQTTLMVNVRPTSASTGAAVTANCSSIGGSSAQSLGRETGE